MRLFDRMRRDGFTVATGTDFDGVTMQVERPFPLAYVVADEAAQRYWQDTDDVVWDLSDYGIIKPPFPFMWIEAELPKRSWIDGGWRPTPFAQSGYMISEGHGADDQPAIAVTECVYSPHGGPRPVMIGKTWMQSLLPDGRGDWSRGCQVLVSHALADIYGDDVHNVPAVALYALSLMNCRNVSVVQDAPTEKRRRAFRKRHGVPMTTFSRIVLPNQSNAGSGGAGGGGEETRHHMVRGHFKTYTAEKPLMGQHVGTYWWSWQVRGDKSKGNVEQTYEVKV